MSEEDKSEEDKNDAVFDMSLFIDQEIAKAFVCSNCGNIPRQCINDTDGKIFCEFCVAQLKIINTKANAAMDKIIDGLKMKCPNINIAHNEDQDEINGGSNNDDNNNDNDNDNDDDEDEKEEDSWTGTVGQWRKKMEEIEKMEEQTQICMFDAYYIDTLTYF